MLPALADARVGKPPVFSKQAKEKNAAFLSKKGT
jgi:hypothetical protein